MLIFLINPDGAVKFSTTTAALRVITPWLKSSNAHSYVYILYMIWNGSVGQKKIDELP